MSKALFASYETADKRKGPEAIRSMPVGGGIAQIPLSEVTTVRLVSGPAEIYCAAHHGDPRRQHRTRSRVARCCAARR